MQFTEDLRLAVRIYERYMLEVYGTTPTRNTEVQIDATEDDED